MSDTLYPKFRVSRAGDGSAVEGAFVLVPETDPHALTALAAYMESCRIEKPGLAADLGAWLGDIAPDEERYGVGPSDDALRAQLVEVQRLHEAWGATDMADINQLDLWETLGRILRTQSVDDPQSTD